MAQTARGRRFVYPPKLFYSPWCKNPCGQLRRLVGIIQDLSSTTVRQRLIALALRLAHTSGTPWREGVRVKLKETDDELAAELSTVRELVSRLFHQLQVEGFLKVNGRTTIVKDLAGLKREKTSSK